MQDHPVPQNVTSYQFRLVGNMTLKQFLELGIGLFLAYVVYLTNLYFFIKWPLVLLSILLGVGLAWFPVEERPLDQWIISFLKAIYRPTRFTWKKTVAKPIVFDYKPRPKESAKKSPVIKKSAASSLPSFMSDENVTELDLEVKAKASEIDRLLSLLPTTQSELSNSPIRIPDKPTIKVRSLSSPDAVRENVIFHSGRPILPTTSATIETQPEAHIIFDTEKSMPKPEPSPTPDSENILLNKREASSKTISIPESKPQSISAPPDTNITESTTPVEQPVLIDKPTASKRIVGDNLAKAQTISQYMPITPKSPNIVVGVVADPQGGIVENAIVQISDHEGIPQRAVKTNELGQFATSTPLKKGDYIIEDEGENLNFPPQKLKVENKIINPLLIQAA